MLALLLVLGAPAHAQTTEPWPEAGEEIVIEASEDLAAARRALETEIWELGYRRRVLRDDRTVFPRPRVWKTKLVLYDDGRLDVRTPSWLPMMALPVVERDDEGEVEYAGLEAAGLVTGKRTVASMERPVFEQVGPALQAWRAALQARHFAERRLEIREEVRRAWYEGLAPDGELLATAADRRAWLIARWLNTADTAEGEVVRGDLEVFIDDVVQRSETPLTRAEIAEANARRAFERVLQPVGG